MSIPASMSMSLAPGPLPVAIALAAGIAIGDAAEIPVPARWVLALILVVLAVRASRGPARPVTRALVLLACACGGAALGARPAVDVPAGVVIDDRGLDRVEGVVDGLVVATRHGFGARLRTDGDAVWVWTAERVRPGERLAVIGRVKTPRGSLGPGQPDREDAVLARGARLEVSATRVDRLGADLDVRSKVLRWAEATQASWSARIERAGGDRVARAALRGIVVGDRGDIPEGLDARWRAVGLFHVLSVSGLHLAVIAGLAFALLRRAIAASPFGGRVRPARWAAPPALAFACAYTLVTGAQLATLRALIVVVLVLVAAMLDRPMRLLDAIGIAAIGVLVWRPADLFDPSFQLSFTAALALACVTRDEARGVRAWIMRALATSAWVTLATAPITAYHFTQITPGGVVGNVVLTPALELVALPLALAGVVIDWAAPIRVATWIVERVDEIAGWLEHVLPIGKIAIADGITLVALVALVLWLVAKRRRTTTPVAWVALCIIWSLAARPAATGELRVTFLDIGQGDAAIVELPDGATWLVDAGGSSKTISRALAVYGKRRVDLAIISHPHPDHYAALAALDVPISEIWSARELEPRPGSEGADFDRVARRAASHAHPPLGVAIARAGVELVVWAPRYETAEAVVAGADPVRSVNDNSLVVEVRYRGRSIVFAGDLEAEGEELLVAAGIGNVDVVKVAHHGSPTSSTPALVAATRPALAVISCGRANQFGFPSPAVVDRWEAAGAEVARTDRDGTIVVRVGAGGALTVERAR